MKEAYNIPTTRGVVAEMDTRADKDVDEVNIMAFGVADTDDLVGAATMVAVDADIMVGAEATTRTKMEVVNKFKGMDTTLPSKISAGTATSSSWTAAVQARGVLLQLGDSSGRSLSYYSTAQSVQVHAICRATLKQ